MPTNNGVAHISTGVGSKTYCGMGQSAFDFRLLDIGHAKACIDSGSRIRPCKKCMRKASETLFPEVE